ncbi:hypothetical protein E2C01_042812 [Portunus trituberculatus]|uniref:Uncharacterized protein n=1 Tax=Portunus trituberculatus TaxID=210409 RepID=A0A5B7FXI7_PORTR|nr:hypothetical protein [Portunus trituberculatus]
MRACPCYQTSPAPHRVVLVAARCPEALLCPKPFRTTGSDPHSTEDDKSRIFTEIIDHKDFFFSIISRLGTMAADDAKPIHNYQRSVSIPLKLTTAAFSS